MTLNATERILYQACETKKLVERRPVRALSQETLCRLFVTPHVNDVLDGKVGNFGPMAEMEKILAITAAGFAVTVSLIGDPNGKKPDLERLSDLDEVWAVCARRPRVFQVRMFGRFVAKGIFAGLAIYDRNWLGFRDTYKAQADKVPALWSDTFGGQLQPHRGAAVTEYLKGVPRDVDQI